MLRKARFPPSPGPIGRAISTTNQVAASDDAGMCSSAYAMPDSNDWNARRPYALSNAREGQRCDTTTSQHHSSGH